MRLRPFGKQLCLCHLERRADGGMREEYRVSTTCTTSFVVGQEIVNMDEDGQPKRKKRMLQATLFGGIAKPKNAYGENKQDNDYSR